MTPPAPLDGLLLYNAGWLAARIEDTGRRWNCTDPRVNATLWWYSASAVLITPAIVTMLAEGRPTEVHPGRLTIWLKSDGYLKGSRADTLSWPDPHRFGQHLRHAWHPIVATLAALGNANPRALWAIAADSLAGRALRAGRSCDEIAGTVTAIARGAAAPLPRYRQREDSWQIRRCSCCLLYQTPGNRKCEDCPRRKRSPLTHIGEVDRERVAESATPQ